MPIYCGFFKKHYYLHCAFPSSHNLLRGDQPNLHSASCLKLFIRVRSIPTRLHGTLALDTRYQVPAQPVAYYHAHQLPAYKRCFQKSVEKNFCLENTVHKMEWHPHKYMKSGEFIPQSTPSTPSRVSADENIQSFPIYFCDHHRPRRCC